jgi:hypothetical protein
MNLIRLGDLGIVKVNTFLFWGTQSGVSWHNEAQDSVQSDEHSIQVDISFRFELSLAQFMTMIEVVVRRFIHPS